MTTIPRKVLDWLHNVLLAEYQDIPRTFSDTVQTLSQNPTIRPQTDVYTFETGKSSLLLHLTGTLPVAFRGATYSFPISLWVPHAYPLEGPIIYVSPTSDMVVRPSQYVSGEGRIYHPYLGGWRADRSNLFEFLQVLQEVFSREPPAISKQEQMARSYPPQRPNGQPPPLPPLPPVPPKTARSSSGGPASIQNGPPPPPPKPYQSQAPSTGGGPPPIPPHPNLSSGQNGYRVSSPPGGQYAPQRSSSLRNDYSSPTSPPRPHPTPYEQQRYPVNPTSPQPPNRYPPIQTQHPQSQSKYEGPPPLPLPGGFRNQASPSNYQNYPPLMGPYPPRQPQQQTYQLPPQQYQQQLPPHRQQSPPPRPQEDLLTSPLDQPLPPQTPAAPPPIPPNPEKDALLHALSQTLTNQLHSQIQTLNSQLPPLAAQNQALHITLQNINSEKAQLQHLLAQISVNTQTLHTTLRSADNLISTTKSPNSHFKPPNIDEVLVAPTVVGEQMYDVVSEMRALRDARAVLGRALDAGRVGVEGWVKASRSLGREEFLRMALVRKIGKGMGLVVEGERYEGEGGW